MLELPQPYSKHPLLTMFEELEKDLITENCAYKPCSKRAVHARYCAKHLAEVNPAAFKKWRKR